MDLPEANSREGDWRMRFPSGDGPTANVPIVPSVFNFVFALSNVSALAARRQATPCPAQPASAVKF